MFKTLSREFRRSHLLVKIAIIVALAYILRCLLSKIEGFEPASELVLYHMSGCPHCTKMMPEWSKFESSGAIKTRKVERKEVPEELKKHNVSSFPTILLLDGNGNQIAKHSGPRTSNGFKEFVSKYL